MWLYFLCLVSYLHLSGDKSFLFMGECNISARRLVKLFELLNAYEKITFSSYSSEFCVEIPVQGVGNHSHDNE